MRFGLEEDGDGFMRGDLVESGRSLVIHPCMAVMVQLFRFVNTQLYCFAWYCFNRAWLCNGVGFAYPLSIGAKEVTCRYL